MARVRHYLHKKLPCRKGSAARSAHFSASQAVLEKSSFLGGATATKQSQLGDVRRLLRCPCALLRAVARNDIWSATVESRFACPLPKISDAPLLGALLLTAINRRDTSRSDAHCMSRNRCRRQQPGFLQTRCGRKLRKATGCALCSGCGTAHMILARLIPASVATR